MRENVEIINTSSGASVYAAVLLGLRLLRALLANLAFTIAFVLVLFELCLVVMITAGIGWFLFDLPWLKQVVQFAIGLAIIAAILVVQVGIVATALTLYTRVQRGSARAGWILLSFSLLWLALSVVDLVTRLVQMVAGAQSERGAAFVDAAQDLLPLYVAVAFTYASIGVIRISRTRYHPLLGSGSAAGRRFRFYRLMGIPVPPSRQARPRRRALVLALLAFGCEGFAFGTYFFSGAPAQASDVSLGVGVALVLIGWPLAVGCLYGLLRLADWLWSRSRLAGQLSLQETTSVDPRPPILFLRGFQDDQLSLASAHVPRYLRVMDPGVVAHRFEEILVWNLSSRGPVIAIGKPGDAKHPIGAAREYLPGRDWQNRVLDHMEKAQAIVVGVSESEGLGWELDQIQRGGYVDKTLMVVPPSLTTGVKEVEVASARAGLTIRRTAGQQAQTLPPDVGPHVLACWLNSSYAPTFALSTRLTELDYELALRLFMTEVLDRR